ncbi:MAG: non-canonical purine NTP pyrophosphatase [Gemmatimonadaceae bacterium]
MATRSSGKLRELQEIFRDFDFDVIDLTAAGIEYSHAEEAIESYATFEENALAKGRYFHDLTGMPTLADDSGLVVDALGGAPGVFSKRFSGRTDLTGVALDEANNEKLLRELQRLGSVSRSARYMCVAAYVGAPGEMIRTGTIEGKVIDKPRGNGGFGYDAYVEVPELGGTMAEAGWEIKAQVSHRGRAFRALLPALREIGWA